MLTDKEKLGGEKYLCVFIEQLSKTYVEIKRCAVYMRTYHRYNMKEKKIKFEGKLAVSANTLVCVDISAWTYPTVNRKLF